MLIMTFLMVQGQRSPCKMKVHVWVSIWHCNYSPIWYRFRDIDLQIYQKNDYILFSAGGPDAANDLKLVSVIKNLSIYHMPKYQNWNTKKNFYFFWWPQFWPSRSSKVKGHGVKWKPDYVFLSNINCNYMPNLLRFWDMVP